MTTTETAEQTIDKTTRPPWSNKIRKDKGFLTIVNDILQHSDDKERILDNCETLWKLGATEQCTKIGGKVAAAAIADTTDTTNEKNDKKKIRNESVLTKEPTSASINTEIAVPTVAASGEVEEEPVRDIVERHSEYTHLRINPAYTELFKAGVEAGPPTPQKKKKSKKEPHNAQTCECCG